MSGEEAWSSSDSEDSGFEIVETSEKKDEPKLQSESQVEESIEEAEIPSTLETTTELSQLSSEQPSISFFSEPIKDEEEDDLETIDMPFIRKLRNGEKILRYGRWFNHALPISLDVGIEDSDQRLLKKRFKVRKRRREPFFEGIRKKRKFEEIADGPKRLQKRVKVSHVNVDTINCRSWEKDVIWVSRVMERQKLLSTIDPDEDDEVKEPSSQSFQVRIPNFRKKKFDPMRWFRELDKETQGELKDYFSKLIADIDSLLAPERPVKFTNSVDVAKATWTFLSEDKINALLKHIRSQIWKKKKFGSQRKDVDDDNLLANSEWVIKKHKSRKEMQGRLNIPVQLNPGENYNDERFNSKLDDLDEELIKMQAYLPEMGTEKKKEVEDLYWGMCHEGDEEVDKPKKRKKKPRRVKAYEKKAKKGVSVVPYENQRLKRGDWLSAISWNNSKTRFNTRLILDVNDPRMLFSNRLKHRAMEKKDERRETSMKKTLLEKINISNDKNYVQRRTRGKKKSVHSDVAKSLNAQMFPIVCSKKHLRNHHRPKVSIDKECDVVLPEKVEEVSGIPKSMEDLSSSHGRLIALEYLEEHPAIMQNVGMASHISHYRLKKQENIEDEPEKKDNKKGDDAKNKVVEKPKEAEKKAEEDKEDEELEDKPEPFDPQGNPTGEKKEEEREVEEMDDGKLQEIHPDNVHRFSKKFFGVPKALEEGLTIPAINNHVFRAPMAKHDIGEDIFLLSRSGADEDWKVRELDGLYAVGQQQAHRPVPDPCSQAWKQFVQERAKVHIYRSFDFNKEPQLETFQKQMSDFPPKVIESVFNAITEKVERGKDQIKVRTHFVSELQEIVTPERASMYESMLAALQRMKDKGISDELLKACWRHNTGKVYISRELVNAWKQIENDEVGDISKPACKLVQQEIESSPCMTSAAFIRAKKKEAMLDLRDSGSHTNPFRPGEGINFALSRDTRDYDELTKNLGNTESGRAFTKGDLRKLTMAQADRRLRQWGYTRKRIASLSRWGKIDAIKKESRRRAAAGDRSKDVMRFARVRGDSAKMKTALFETHVGDVFLEHMKMLSKTEVPENDDDLDKFAEEFDDSDTDFEEFDSDEVPTQVRKTPLFDGVPSVRAPGGWDAEDSPMILPGEGSMKVNSQGEVSKTKRKVLLYTYEETDVETGKRVKQEREIDDPKIVRDYIMYQRHPTEEFRRKWEQHDVSIIKQRERQRRTQLEEQHREKRIKQLQKQLQDLDRSDERKKKKLQRKLDEYKKRGKPIPRCSACGQMGHMKTNTICPMYKYEETAGEKGLVKTHGKSITIDMKGLRKHNREQARAAKGPGRFSGQMEYTAKRTTSSRKRMRGEGSHILDLCKILHECMKELKKKCDAFTIFYADPRHIAGYAAQIDHPMCCQWIEANVKLTEKHTQLNNSHKELEKPHARLYQNSDDFLEELKWIRNNSMKFNGETSPYTQKASKMVVEAQEFLDNHERLKDVEVALDKVMRRKNLKPVFEEMTNKFKTKDHYGWFNQAVDTKRFNNYSKKIKKPMHFKKIGEKLTYNQYKGFNDFSQDLKLIYTNARDFNNPDHHVTKAALRGLQAAEDYAREHFAEIKEKDPDAHMSFIELGRND